MHCCRWTAGTLALALLLVSAGAARAERVPSSRTVLPPSSGARTDITVPYLTNGRSTLGVAQGVAPAIVRAPVIDAPVIAPPVIAPPQINGVTPVYNLPFYGSVQGFNSGFNGATPRPPVFLRPSYPR